LGLVVVCGFFASIALHELGHAAVAMRYGCGVQQILLLPIGGVAQLSHLPEQPRAEVAIALAGPAVSLGIGVAAMALAYPFHALGAEGTAVCFNAIGAVNLMLCLFNLLPCFPMDGGRVLRAGLTPRIGRLRATFVATRIGRSLAIVLGLIGVWRLNLILVAIAVFVFRAAGREYRMIRIQERFRFRPAAGPHVRTVSVDGGEMIVEPPPRTRSPADRLSESWGRVSPWR
jgi:stage IV sporulation protein FB